jgi:hypothetical protein
MMATEKITPKPSLIDKSEPETNISDSLFTYHPSYRQHPC